MNIVSKIRERAHEYSEYPAVIESDRMWTHAELYERVDRLSNAFLDMGARKGDRLLCWLPNIREALETELACLQAGLVWVTLHAGLTWAEVENVFLSTEPSVFVTNARQLNLVRPTSTHAMSVVGRASLLLQGPGEASAAAFADCAPYEAAIQSASKHSPEVDVLESDLARLRYTSGTTGAAKAAMLTHRVYLGSLANLQEHLHAMDPTDRVLHAAPLTHASAALTYPILAAGGANVILPGFDPAAVLEAIERYRITTMFAVPTMLYRLSAQAEFATRDLSSIRTISYGGAPMAVEKLPPILERLGPVLMQIYGLTEALHPVTCLKRDEHFIGNPKLGSAGTLSSSCRVRITNDAGQEVAEGDVGEFHISGPITFEGYWRDPDETAGVLKDAWVASGDLGYRDADGYYWIVDRKKNVIISGGFNVYTAEVEAVLSSHPEIEEAAVIGLPHEDWGEIVHAVVRPHAGRELDATELIAWCRQRLAGYKTPKAISFMTEALPKNAAGKLVRRELRALVSGADATRRQAS